MTRGLTINLSFLVIFIAAFGLPVFLLIQWTLTAWTNGEVGTSFWTYIGNSVFLSATAATAAAIHLAQLSRSRGSRAIAATPARGKKMTNDSTYISLMVG